MAPSSEVWNSHCKRAYDDIRRGKSYERVYSDRQCGAGGGVEIGGSAGLMPSPKFCGSLNTHFKGQNRRFLHYL